MTLGRVTQVSPLRVKLNGDDADVPATWKRSDMPTLSVGDDVLCATVERGLVVLQKLTAL